MSTSDTYKITNKLLQKDRIVWDESASELVSNESASESAFELASKSASQLACHESASELTSKSASELASKSASQLACNTRPINRPVKPGQFWIGFGLRIGLQMDCPLGSIHLRAETAFQAEISGLEFWPVFQAEISGLIFPGQNFRPKFFRPEFQAKIPGQNSKPKFRAEISGQNSKPKLQAKISSQNMPYWNIMRSLD